METLSGSLIGMRLGRYRIDAYLGAGSRGEVYRALDMHLHRAVALKLLRPHLANDRDRLERFFAEARAANVIRHDHLIEYTDMHQDGPGGRNYLVMELLKGRTLTQAIRDSGRLVPERAVFIAAQVADALEAAHRAGIVHRDLKPDNLFLIHRMGIEDYVKVLDFGVARLRPELTRAKATQTGVLIGTPAYMPPEQCMGERATPAADIYALGVILFEMLTGQLPFDKPTIPRLLMAHVTSEPPLVPEVPMALSKLVAQALAKQPGNRPSSMAAMRDAMLASVDMAAFAPLRRNRAWHQRHRSELPPAEQCYLAAMFAATERAHRMQRSLFGRPLLTYVVMAMAGLLPGAWLALQDRQTAPMTHGTELLVLHGHKEGVWSASFSPDGTRIVSASLDNTVRVWRTDGSGKSVVLRGHDEAVSSASFSPDGTHIVSASLDKTVRVWNADGRGDPLILHGHRGSVQSVDFGPGGTRIVSASSDNTVRVWRADGSGEPLILRGHDEGVESASFSPDGTHIVSVSRDQTVRVWNADGSGEPLVLRGHAEGVESASFSPDGARIVSAFLDKTVRIWRTDGSGEPVVLRGHDHWVSSACFSPDGQRIASVSWDKTGASVERGRKR